VTRRCSACSHDVPADSRFCPACGAALARDAIAQASTVAAGSSVLTSTSGSGATASQSIDHGRFVPGMLVGDRYRIVERLGRGGMGEVYRADDLQLDQCVALKFLPQALAKDEGRLERFRNEVRVARNVAHPAVCRVYDIGQIDGDTYLSMEYIDGEDLASLLRRIGRVPEDKAVEIARQLCAGLAAAHEKGVLHRDLKPMNVMIDGHGKVRITDFGLAALAEELEGAEARSGTPAYMSPEQLIDHQFSARSDIYALGLVLYELFTGRRAFEARSIADLTRLQSEETLTSPSTLIEGFDPAVERTILHCLSRDPNDRPESALKVAAGLPGGDPLAAALAAGETPSPELVAATEGVEGMPPAAGLACLIVILLGILGYPLLNDRIQLHAFVPLPKRPDVLADRAQEVLHFLGYRQTPADSAFGLAVNQQLLNEIEARDRSDLRWTALVDERQPAIEFWYRQSTRNLVPTNRRSILDYDDPPQLEPGMVRLRLSPVGNLLALDATTTQRVLPEVAAEAKADFAALFREAHLNLGRFQRVPPDRVPPVFSDEHLAWRGRVPGNTLRPVRVEAAAYHGRVVYFRVLTDWRASGEPASPRITLANRASRVLGVALLAAAMIGALFLVHRNLTLGRGDRRGAFRLGLFILSASSLGWLLGADHVPALSDELRLIANGAGQATFLAAMCWLLYIAIEPLVRRLWPDMLISWSRFVSGRFADPLVGRDILIGGLFGIFGTMLLAVRHFGDTWFGAPPPPPLSAALQTFLGVRQEIVELLNLLITAVLQPMLLVVILLVLLAGLRYRSAAVSAFFVVIVGVLTLGASRAGESVYLDLAYFSVLVAAVLFVLLRFGLLALVFSLFFYLLLQNFPITLETSAWYFDSALFAMVLAGVIAAYGFYAALGGRPLLQPETVRR